ncbi:MAG: alternative ribosome rescue aminoacyl-tRNA hydrolase ArfB [Bacteroidota bacterium]
MNNKRRRIRVADLMKELTFHTARSGGPGGQHVNKVETKVVLKFNIDASVVLSDLEKEMIRRKHRSKVTQNGDLMVSSDSKRSQVRNKEIALKKLDRLLAQAFEQKKVRKATQPSKAAKARRLRDKKLHGEKKRLRRGL